MREAKENRTVAKAAKCAARWRVCQNLVIAAATAMPAMAISQGLGPLLLSEQGSFFIGGDKKQISVPATAIVPAQSGEITVNQMYVQYQIPVNGDQHVPVVMVHGCCLSSKTWESTPDGRMGWSEYFVRRGRPVYLADQASRARSGFDPTPFYLFGQRKTPAGKMPDILVSTHQLAWKMFRFGPKFDEVFPDEQFPTQAVNEFYKQMIPDLNAMLPESSNPTWGGLVALSAKLNGAVLIAHSQSGFFPERAGLIAANRIRGIVSIETQCQTDLKAPQLALLAKIPTLILFGDHLGDVILTFYSKTWSWADAFASCQNFATQLKEAGGDIEVMYLPKIGIKGNSHMLMQDKNSDVIANLVIEWIDRHVEAARSRLINRAN